MYTYSILIQEVLNYIPPSNFIIQETKLSNKLIDMFSGQLLYLTLRPGMSLFILWNFTGNL